MKVVDKIVKLGALKFRMEMYIKDWGIDFVVYKKKNSNEIHFFNIGNRSGVNDLLLNSNYADDFKEFGIGSRIIDNSAVDDSDGDYDNDDYDDDDYYAIIDGVDLI